MSSGPRCRCGAGKRAWVVTARRCNFSAFSGSRWTPSEYSEVRCLECRYVWRTKAAYVRLLPDAERGA